MKKLSTILCLLLVAFGLSMQAKKVHTLGDSTMAPYDENATVTRGWGMYFGQFLTGDWTSVNYAKGGRDTYGGYNELWQTAKKQVEPGDYVIISFAHNDEKNGGMDGYELKAYYESIGNTTAAAAVDLRGSIPSTTYKANLRKIAEEAQRLGANPILVGAVCRSYFSNGKIRRNGRHDLGDDYSILTDNGPTEKNKLPADDHTMDYTYQMEQLAKEMGLPFINLTQATAELYESYGDTKCHEMLFDGEGSTHFNTTGALLVARTCAQMMKAQGILADNIAIPTDLNVSPLDGDFGQAYKGQTLQKEFTLSGFGLQPENGTVTVAGTSGIELSTDKQNWSSSLRVSYQASTLIQTFYAKVTLAEAGTKEGTITIASADKSIEIPVTATAIVLEGGTEVDAYWRLESDDSYVLTGPATVIPQSWKGMYVQRYTNPNANTVWPDWTGYEATRKTQRNLVVGDAWPADEIDDNPERYIQWGIEPADGTTLSIDEISLFACGCGGNGMCSHIYFSTDNFQTRTTMFEMKKMPANNMQYVEAKPVVKLKQGQQLLVRVYPWYNGAATGKTICLSDLHIHGMAQEASDTGEEPVQLCTVSTAVVPDGAGTATASQTRVAPGTEVTFTATANKGYEFVSWNDVAGGVLSTDNPATIVINQETTICAQFKEVEEVSGELGTITFPFNLGTEGQTATFSNNVASYFKNSYVEHGDNVVLKDVNSGQTRFQPVVNNDGSASDGNRIDFMVIPVAGIKFVPTSVSFNTTRYGTDGGKVDVSWINSDGTTLSIATGISPARNNATPNVTAFSSRVANAPESDGLCGLRLNLYSLGNTKQVGFSDIVIQGTISGTTQDVPHYTLNVKLQSDEAGRLTIKPNATEFDEGDEVTLSILENFGYHFTAWVDAQGIRVSTDNPYTFNITADTDLTATFSKSNTYALDVTLTEGARDNLVQIQPEGTMIDGRRMYEEGQDVKLTALSNKVLTFVGWEDNSTDAERTIRMDGDKALTANFSADDYIVGWDFYYDSPNQERAADYKSDSENAGLLSLHNEKGETSGWLTRGIGNGQENGRYAARIWRLRSMGLYFEASFSTKGYKNIKVTSSLGCSYNTYTVNHLQYSVDGVNYQTVATFDITGSGWFDKEDVALGSDADEQERVYVRWMPDRNAPLVGASSDYDGLAISDVFITAEAGSLADEEAVLVSSNPEQGANGVSANGSIILTFDKKIKAGKDVATLQSVQGSDIVEITPIISGKSAVFKYSGLNYNTDYTFQMPEGVLLSRSGNPVAAATISFTTMERTQPQPRLYDAVVDANFAATSSASSDGIPTYATVQAAIDAAPAGRALPWLIFIKNGDYKEHVDIPKTKPYIHLIGQTRDGVVIKDDRLSGGDNAVHVSVGATVVVNSDNVFIEGLTMENSWGHEKQAGPQALALNTGGDRIAMNRVRLLSYQDTWITTSTSNNRHYIKNSLIEGAVDFIYNSGNVYLDGDTLEINRPSGGYIVAPSHGADVKWGYVFMNNVLRPVKGMNVTDIWLGRPWHNQPKTVFINLQTYINIPAAGWYETMGGLPALWADYNTVDANGNPVDLSKRRDTYYYTASDGTRVYGTAKNHLTADEAAQYTLKNVMGGDDNWQPDLMCEACDAPHVTKANGTISWQPVPYAICYVVTRNDEVVGFTTETEFDVTGTDADSYKVQAVNEFGGLSQFGHPDSTPTGIETVGQQTRTAAPAVYDMLGRRIDGQRHTVSGQLHIVCQADGTFKKTTY
ncbi:MAG: Ig-like domain-containing protein [Prevotella sp.]|nr:Ig-like domain-containing protein [Prevotella sp.]